MPYRNYKDLLMEMKTRAFHRRDWHELILQPFYIGVYALSLASSLRSKIPQRCAAL